MYMIRLDKVTKVFYLGNEPLTILHPITLNIKKSSFVTIVGPSGSGKSTLMYLLGLLDAPTTGKVFINDIDTSRLSDEKISALRNQFIGFIFQQFNLVNKLTVMENILLPSIYSLDKSQDFKQRAFDLMSRFGIDHRKDSFPNKISGGEQQRAAIARALLLNPEVILADEPTGNLDSKNGKIILDYLKTLHKEDKKTVIIITHEQQIAAMGKQKIKIKDGRIN
ncbi:ABC transporter ATP-binding protein [Candidatus Roizmanbacteria bacterium RIFCSPHIGHO2_01_FULL_39_12b]|uniref:ABC transporter ATP-binding protein n=1 Tax=Candidatus Roizmanbacteria bacterium RIFCSPHIGHO2_01_FULL_39_12b TaxID=1802030 RepID=A0A1F7GCA5_9BACT|nr:MAG: ABC transporter ATP-binding protein [Candidatus Roizmanbacteria bacterium RIFCSPHIGHO2_01_FULL_39_12b]OGK47173.1 MAG: ABC transporter ATP-binding protein [Candidatus Roizmanbacteria bacterium RIFCSPLOWO2_01_FULL_39_19]